MSVANAVLPSQTEQPAPVSRKQPVPVFWMILIATLLVIAHAPLLFLLGKRMWASEHYQFFPVILGSAAFLAWQRRIKWTELKHGATFFNFLHWGIAWAVLAAAIHIRSPWLGGVSAMISLWATTYSLGGRPLLVKMLPVWAYLWLAVPLPLGLDQQLIVWLQQIATAEGSSLLDLMGYRHLIAGVTLEFPNHSYLIEEACSGIHSLLAALGCTVCYLIYLERGFLRTLLLILMAVFWVTVANAARVVAVVVLDTRWNLPVVDGVGHETLGIIVFLMAILLVVSTERLLLFFLPVREPGVPLNGRPGRRWIFFRQLAARSRGPAIPAKTNEPDDSRGARIARTTQAVILLLGFGILASWQVRIVLAAGPQNESRKRNVRLVTAEMLPAEINGWRQDGFEMIKRKPDDPNGQTSQRWRYRKGDRTIVVSADGPFVGWHNLAGCLIGQGWTVNDTTNVPYRDLGEDLPGGYTELSVEKGVTRRGFVLFGIFDEANRPYTPPENYMTFRAVRRFPKLGDAWDRVSGGDSGEGADSSRTWQLHLFSESYQPAAAQNREELRSLFQTCRRQLLAR